MAAVNRVTSHREGDCSICLEPLAQPIVAHELTHAFHETCLKANYAFSSICPNCRQEIIVPLTLSERIHAWKPNLQAFKSGIFVGTFLGVAALFSENYLPEPVVLPAMVVLTAGTMLVNRSNILSFRSNELVAYSAGSVVPLFSVIAYELTKN